MLAALGVLHRYEGAGKRVSDGDGGAAAKRAKEGRRKTRREGRNWMGNGGVQEKGKHEGERSRKAGKEARVVCFMPGTSSFNKTGLLSTVQVLCGHGVWVLLFFHFVTCLGVLI